MPRIRGQHPETISFCKSILEGMSILYAAIEMVDGWKEFRSNVDEVTTSYIVLGIVTAAD